VARLYAADSGRYNTTRSPAEPREPNPGGKTMSAMKPLMFCAVILVGSTAFAQDPKPDGPAPTPANPAPVSSPEKSESKPSDESGAKAKTKLTDPKEILTKANEATDAVNVVSYKIDIRRLDTPKYHTNEMGGRVLMTDWDGEKPEKFLFHIEARPAGSSEVAETVVGSDGKQFYVISKKTKTAYVGNDPSALGYYRMALRYFPMYEFVIPNPFQDEINAPKLDYLGVEKVEDVECVGVSVEYANQAQKALWYFGNKDWLPRRVKRHMIDPEGASLNRQTTVTDIVVDPKLEEDAFAFKLPEGFTKVEGSAP